MSEKLDVVGGAGNEAFRTLRSDARPDDALLDALHWFCKHYESTISPEALVSGLPLVKGKLTLELLPRAAKRAQLKARVVKRDIKDLHALLLPSILLLVDGAVGILAAYPDAQQAELIIPDSGHRKRITLESLKKLYTGRAILLAPERDYDARAVEYAPPRPESWFWGLIWEHRNIYGMVLLAALLINMFGLAAPLFVMNVYDRVVPNEALATLWALAIGVGIVIVFDFILRSLRGWFIDLAGRKADVRLSQRLFEQVLGMRMSHQPASTGSFANQLHEFEGVRDFLTSASIAALVDLPFVFLFILVIWLIGGSVAYVPLVALPLLLLVGILLERPMRKCVEQQQVAASQKHAIAVEAISNLSTIKITRSESVIQRKWEDFTARAAQLSLKSRGYSLMAINSATFAQQLVYVGVVVVGVYQVHAGDLSLGGLIACSILSGRALAPLAGFANLLTRFERFRVAMRGMNKLIELPQERPYGQHFLRRERLEGNIRLERVSFQYPNVAFGVLENVSLDIRAGEKVGIVGPIGAGKSTIFRLLVNLYPVESGAILLDGTDLRQIDPLDLRRNVTLLSQDANLFYGTLRENIAFAAPWAEDEQILEVARMAGVDAFARLHPQGYDMRIGERGEGLSGGQKQSVGIARALLVNAPILVMDEPTSAMDRRTELRFENMMREHVKDKTLLLATHKSQLLSLVDRLIVIDHGRVIADGPKDDVLKALAASNQPGGMQISAVKVQR